MIHYTTDIEDLRGARLDGFFRDWPNPPGPDVLRRALENAHCFCAALSAERTQLIGFAYAISDGIFYSYIPLVEVLPQYRQQGIGAELITRLLGQLTGHYAVDLCCDRTLEPFYERLGFSIVSGAVRRDFRFQSGCGLEEGGGPGDAGSREQ